MKLWSAALLAVGAAALRLPEMPFADIISDDVSSDVAVRRIPTSAESAVLARRLLALSPYGTISTVFAHVDNATASHRPEGLDGVPIATPEYLADCEGDSGNPTLLAITIATAFRNAAAGSNVSLALQWTPPPAHEHRSALGRLQKMLGWKDADQSDLFVSVASLPRVSMLGYLEPITASKAESPLASLTLCFLKKHPDAHAWLPGSPVHESSWMRLVVQQVFWVGGFGDRNYIGFLPIDEWRSVTRADWEQVRLPGEKKSWPVDL